MRLPADVSAPTAAREMVRSLDWLPSGMVPNALIVVTELVTNAVLHPDLAAPAPIGVRASATGRGLCLVVEDAGAGFADGPLGMPPTDELHGRGLAIVGRLAERWGHGPSASGGFRVWAELAGERERATCGAPWASP